MPNVKSAAKRAKTSAVSRTKNIAAKANILTLGRRLIAATSANDKTKSQEIFRAYSSALDKAAKKGIITRNTAARKKSRSALKIKAMK